MTLKSKIALMFRSFAGYYLYYIEKQGVIVSTCWLKHNYMGKYAFLKEDDLLINPYSTLLEYRGMGLATNILTYVVNDYSVKWNRLYALVKTDNYASIKVLSSVGFEKIGYSKKINWSHTLSHDESDIIVFCYMRGNNVVRKDAGP